ncbi:hypothetical protein ACS78_20920 [Priestia megaterium]|nr:hypothetical protein ACS78_20920 [Priestia megaterium]
MRIYVLIFNQKAAYLGMLPFFKLLGLCKIWMKKNERKELLLKRKFRKYRNLKVAVVSSLILSMK